MRSTLTLALAASATLLVTACGDGEESGGVTPGGRLDLTLSAAGFDPHNGEVMSVALVDGAGAIIATRAALVANGGFTMTFPASLEAAAGYTLAYYVDHDRDGRCGSPGLAGDHGWQIELTAGDQAVTRSLTHNLNFAPSVCGRFPLYDLALAGSFAPHANQDMYVAVIRDLDGLVVNATTTRVPADGYLALTIPGVVQAGTTYSIDHYADVDGDGICEGPAFTQDHGWRSRVGEVSGSVAVAGSDAAAFEPEVCASFPGGQPGGPFDLSITGSGFTPHNGQVLSLALSVDGTIQARRAVVVTNGGFAMTLPAGLELGRSYRIDYYVDRDRDGICSPPTLAGDHGWSSTISVVSGAVDLALTHSISFDAAVCGSFPTRDLSFAGAYLPHAGQTMYAALVREIDSRLVASTSTVVPAGGAVSLPLAGRLQDGLSYRWDYFADTNADGLCTGPSLAADHGWRIDVPTVSGNVQLTRDHDTNFAPAVCSSFGATGPTGPYTLNISGSGFAPHDGQVLSLALSTDGAVQARRVAVVTGGAFSFTLPDFLVAGKTYRLDYYADRDLDGICSPPTLTGDHGWSSTISVVSGAVDLALTHSISFDAAVCGSFPTRDLSFAGAYLPHAGQTMYAALVREIDSRLVASTSTVVPAGGAVSLPLAGRLQDGLSYRWDYFADTNADGLCTGPSFVEDHAWQIQVPEVDGNVILSRDHDTAFAAVCASF